MTDDELLDLALENGASVVPHPKVPEITLIKFTLEELHEFVLAVNKEVE